MADLVECKTQADLEAAVKNGNIAVVKSGFFSASDSASVRAYGSASVRAYDSASVRAYDSASVRASGSASVRAYDSASVRAYDSASVRASGSASVRATPFVAIQRTGELAKVDGGVLIQIPVVETVQQFCEFYGLDVTRGSVTLYKLVDGDYVSAHGTAYKPGEKAEAVDWDPEPYCGQGLHFSPRAFMARKYASPAKERFVACKVKVKDIVVITDYGTVDKVKAKACSVLFECDEDGVELTPSAVAA